MVGAVRCKDWSSTPLGAMADWPASLRIAARICLDSQFPMVIFWGPDLILIYNDAYRPMLGGKHPWALGQRGSDVWSEVWEDAGGLFHQVMKTGTATVGNDFPLLLERHGFTEECYFTCSHSPIMEDGGHAGGVFTTVLETTERVIGERRMRTLGDLASTAARKRGHTGAFPYITDVLMRNPRDIPFAMLYLVDGESRKADLAFACGFDEGVGMPADQVPLDTAMEADDMHAAARAFHTAAPVLRDVAEVAGAAWKSGIWPKQAQQALALPLWTPGHGQARGVLVFGINVRRPFDNGYREFFESVCGHIATVVASIEAGWLLAHDDKTGSRISRSMRHAFADKIQRNILRDNDEMRLEGHTPAMARSARHDAPQATASGMRLLIVEDNEDMARYLMRLLDGKCEVLLARNGERGLEMARAIRPDLILTDMMMPGMDGFALLGAIRADEDLRTTSVIVLSARADENTRMKAIAAGADDYLVKPFNARELIGKITAQVQMVWMRRDAVTRERELLHQIMETEQDMQRVLDGMSEVFGKLDRNLRMVALNDAAAALAGLTKEQAVGRLITDIAPQIEGNALHQALLRVIARQQAETIEHRGTVSGRWFILRCYPAPQGVILLGTDITERKNAEQMLQLAHDHLEARVAARTRELQEANKMLSAVFDRAPGSIALTDIEGHFISANAAYRKLLGVEKGELAALTLADVTHPDDYPRKKEMLKQLLDGTRESFEMEMRYRLKSGAVLWVNNYVSSIDDETHRPRYFVKITQDITDRKRAEQKILASERELRALYGRLQMVREEERIALAREVHDQLGQILSAAKIDIKLLEEDVRSPDVPLSREKIATELGCASQTIETAIQSIRRIATELRPPELDDHGLGAAIEWHAADVERRTRIKCSVTVAEAMLQPAGTIAITVFRIFQEAMTNVLRHAQASQVWITLDCHANAIRLRVRDNGTGIAPARERSARSLGIKGMRERAALVGGRLTIGRMRPRGTLVAVRVPIGNGAGP
jgi:PAS domain S-box-containing protein